MGHTLPMTYLEVVITSNIEVTQGQKVELGQILIFYFENRIKRYANVLLLNIVRDSLSLFTLLLNADLSGGSSFLIWLYLSYYQSQCHCFKFYIQLPNYLSNTFLGKKKLF